MTRNTVTLLLVTFILQNTDGFQWSSTQLSSEIVSSYIGSNVNLPCQFELSREEDEQSQQFHVVLWSKETPLGSKTWEGLATLTHVAGLNQSSSQIISPKSSKYKLSNKTLTIVNVGMEDDTQYQCEVKSSFYSSPSVIKVNVVYKPFGTKITGPTGIVNHKASTIINCTAKANPKPGYSFYHNKQLVQNSSSQYYVINTTLTHHKGEYMCVPWNQYGHGPNATITVKVQDVKQPDKNILSDEIIAGITGAVVLALLIIVVAAIMCQRYRSDKQEGKITAKDTSNSNKDLNGAHLGPAMYGSDGNISEGTSSPRIRDMNGTHVGPAFYGSDSKNDKSVLGKPAIYKLDRPSIYGTDSDFSQLNGTYTAGQDHKIFRLDKPTYSYPSESDL